MFLFCICWHLLKIPNDKSHKYLPSMCLESGKSQYETILCFANSHWAKAGSSARAFYIVRSTKEFARGVRDFSWLFVSRTILHILALKRLQKWVCSAPATECTALIYRTVCFCTFKHMPYKCVCSCQTTRNVNSTQWTTVSVNFVFIFHSIIYYQKYLFTR